MNDHSKYPIRDEVTVPPDVLLAWQRLLDLIAEVFAVPAALIMRVHADEIEVFGRSATQGNVYQAGERAALDTGLYCETVMSTRRHLLVADAVRDPDWDKNPDLKLGMIAYLGFPLLWPGGEVFGTICVLDSRENRFSTTYVRLLEQFRHVVEGDLLLLDAEQRLRESESRYRTMFDTVLDPIYVCELDGTVIDSNSMARDSSGFSREALHGRPLTDLLDLEPETWRADVQPQLAAGGRFQVDTHHRRRDGKRFTVELQVATMSLDDRTIAIAVAHDITERKALEEQLHRLAITDPLTGILNRTRLQQELEKEVAGAQRYGRPVSIAMLDIDHFKAVNDRYGHEQGDRLLIDFAATVSAQLRHSDSFFRYGGEEFIVLMGDTEAQGAHAVAERMRAAVAAHPFEQVGQITMSIGVSQYRPGEHWRALFERADKALYAAKDAGRNAVVVA